MTTDFRALCAELADVLEGLFDEPEIPGEIRRSHSLGEHLTRARAALADEPAPKGGEPVSFTGQFTFPAAVTGQPSDADLHAMAFRFSQPCFDFEYIPFARTVLARWGNPAPHPPAEGEVAELVQHLRHAADVDGWDGASPEWCQSMLRAADLLQRPSPPQPVPVSERPWEGEGWCDKQGRCWFGREESDDWSADWTMATPEAVEEFCTYAPQTVCLPAHALPIPQQQENTND